MKRAVYVVTARVTHESRPSLKTQAQTSVVASDTQEAERSGREILAKTWIVGETMSVIRKYAVRK